MSDHLAQAAIDDHDARRAALARLSDAVAAKDLLGPVTDVSGTADELLTGIDLSELARAVLVERISRRLVADTALTVAAVRVMQDWHEEDEPPTWPELLEDLAVEVERQAP